MLVLTSTDEATVTQEPRSVLLVEDDADHRLLIETALDRSGHHRVVGAAATADDGVRLAERLQPDVLLLDLRLRQSSGAMSIPRLLVVAPRTMIVVVSALSDPVARETALAAGAFAFLEKCPRLFAECTLARLLDDLSTRFAEVLDGDEAVAPVMIGEALFD